MRFDAEGTAGSSKQRAAVGPLLKLAPVASVMWFATPALAGPAATAEELRTQIQQLRAEQDRIAEMQRQVAARLQSLETGLSAMAAASAANEPTSAPAAVALPPDQPRLAVSADLRLRWQGDYADAVRDRESVQMRGRIAATYSVNDRITVGVRLATGDPDDPNSTDVQLSNFDDDLQVSLDQAYVRLNLGDLDLYGGKMPQAFTRTELVWDGDVNPQGFSAVYNKPLDGGAALRANGLFFIVDENAVAADSTMLGAQLGYDFAASADLKFDVSVGYYDYTLGSVVGADSGDFRSNLRNPDGSYRSDFDLGDLIVGATWTGANARWPVRAVGNYIHNFGAATPQDTGYSLDLAVGRASQVSDWRLTYGYSVAETDAVLAAFAHDNIALATNYRLHALTLDYVPLPKTLVSAIWYHYKPYAAGAEGGADWLERVRLAFLINF